MLTVSIGSSNLAFQWALFLLQKIDFSSWEEVFFIVSPTFEKLFMLQELSEKKKICLKTNVKQEELASLYRESDIVLVTGGMSLYEALTAGAAVVTYPLLKEMLPEVSFLEQQEVLVSLGTNGMSRESVSRELLDLKSNEVKKQALRKRAQNLFDGNGLERIISLFDNVYHDLMETRES